MKSESCRNVTRLLRENKLNQEFLSEKPVGRSVLLAAWSCSEPEVNGG